MREVLRREGTVVDVDVEDGTFVTVCGDVHGQFYDLINIFEINGALFSLITQPPSLFARSLSLPCYLPRSLSLPLPV